MALFMRDGDTPIEVMGRARLDAAAARRMLIKEMIVMHAQGYSYREIGLKYSLSHTRVFYLVKGAPAHVEERLREIGLVR